MAILPRPCLHNICSKLSLETSQRPKAINKSRKNGNQYSTVKNERGNVTGQVWKYNWVNCYCVKKETKNANYHLKRQCIEGLPGDPCYRVHLHGWKVFFCPLVLKKDFKISPSLCFLVNLFPKFTWSPAKHSLFPCSLKPLGDPLYLRYLCLRCFAVACSF